jgi:hypothetical protein
MKQTLLAILMCSILVLTLSSTAQADSFLTVSVNGGPATTFTSVSNTIITGTFSVSGITFTNITLTGNQPGTATGAFSTDTKTAVTNTTGATASIAIGFASNNYSLPAGTPLIFNASQTVNVANFGASNTAITQNFTGYGDISNSLAPGTGVADVTPACTVVNSGGPTNACATSGPVSSFARLGNFGLNGVETFMLAAGQTADFSGTINASPTPAVPEPTSVLLFGSGMLILVARKWHNRKR